MEWLARFLLVEAADTQLDSVAATSLVVATTTFGIHLPNIHSISHVPLIKEEKLLLLLQLTRVNMVIVFIFQVLPTMACLSKCHEETGKILMLSGDLT